MAKKLTLNARYQQEAARRDEVLVTARECAALTKPWILPPENHQATDRLPENYQSTGSRGLTNLEGRMLLALFPPGVPWFQSKLAPSIQYARDVPDKLKQDMAAALLLRDLTIVARLEQSKLERGRYQHRAGFRSRKRMAIGQVLGTGDALEHLTDDYRLKLYGREQYVTRRDSSMDVAFHIIHEKIDVQRLTDDQYAATGFPGEVRSQEDPAKREKDLYTLVEWNYASRTWVIRQEMNGETIIESEEPVSPYFSTPFELGQGDARHYGRGFIEQNLGDLRSHNELRERKLDFAEMCSRLLAGIDKSSDVREQDLEKPTGSVVRNFRIVNGQIQDVAFLKVDKVNDFQVVHLTDEAIRGDLGKAMLMESEVTPRGDRVTAYQTQRVAMELEGALGGVYSSISDNQQVPLLHRLDYQMERDNLLPKLPDDSVEVEVTTGIAALSRELDSARLTTLIGGIAQLGDAALAKINIGVLVDTLARYASFYEPGLVKSDEQVAREQRAAALQQLAMAAGEKGIDTIGNIAEAQATQQPTNTSE